MSSHREAPEISKDPVADSTDLYAFVSPDAPDTVTLIANYLPLQSPAGGPNFYEFGDDVLYQIHIDNNGDGRPDISYRFEFTTTVTDKDTFLYNTGPIEKLDSPNWNRRQTYSVTRVDADGRSAELGHGLACPPCNIGPLSTPDYPGLARDAVHQLGHGRRVFAGQRAEGFYVDLGAIFDLAILRPLADLHATFGQPALAKGPGVNTTAQVNVHSIALQVPIRELTRDCRQSTEVADPNAVIGVWTTASRRKAVVREEAPGYDLEYGAYTQVSRLANPLFNEVLVPMARKDAWNALPPADDKAFADYVAHPELASLLPGLYPGEFTNLAALVASGSPRADLEAILLTGIPEGVIAGFQNHTGDIQADMLRLNTAVPPTTSNPNPCGLVAGDPAGFPNGRRVADDVVTIELRAIAGLTYPLIDKNYTPDAAVGMLTDGLTAADVPSGYLPDFPYLGLPYSGYTTP